MATIAPLFQSAKEYEYPVRGNVIAGSVPEWFKGQLSRIGPGVFDLDGGFTVNYVMDGFAVASRFVFENGQVSFGQRTLNSEAYTKAKICKKPIYAEYGTRAYPDTTKNILKRLMSTLVPTDLTDNNCGNIYRFENELFVASETCFVHTIDPKTLQKKTKVNFADSISGVILMTSHPSKDSSGATWNIAATAMPLCKYFIVKFPQIGDATKSLQQAEIMATIPSSFTANLTYQHSFPMSENYLMFVEQPLRMSILKMAQMGIKGNSVKDAFEWHSDSPSIIHVYDKVAGKVLKTLYQMTSPLLFLHYVNVFEINGSVVIDALAYPSAKVLEKAKLQSLRNNEWSPEDPSRFCRFVLPIVQNIKDVSENVNLLSSTDFAPGATAVRIGDKIMLTPEFLFDAGIEFTATNPQHEMKDYEYLYGTAMHATSGTYVNSLVKANVKTGEVIQRTTDSDCYFTEVYFVPAPRANDQDQVIQEDVGLVIAVKCRAKSQSDSIMLYDAQTMEVAAEVEFSNTKFSPFTHGIYLDE